LKKSYRRQDQLDTGETREELIPWASYFKIGTRRARKAVGSFNRMSLRYVPIPTSDSWLNGIGLPPEAVKANNKGEMATTSKEGSRRANYPILTQGGSDKK
jgi:hypothetical protein